MIEIKNIILRRFLIILFLVLFVTFCGFQLFLLIYPKIKTEIAYIAQIFDSLDSNAYILRDECTILENQKDKYVNFVLSDGEKINKNDVIAQIYSIKDQCILHKEIENLENKIKSLDKLNITTISNNLELLNFQITQNSSKIAEVLVNNRYCELRNLKKDFLYLLNEKKIITNENTNYLDKISDLKQKLSNLTLKPKNQAQNIFSDKTGYFFGKTDGLENSFNYNDILTIMPDQINYLLNNNSSNVFKNNKLAKIVKNPKWYIICNLPKNYVEKLNIGQIVKIELPLSDINKIDAKIVAINKIDNNSDIAVVFQSDYINNSILSIRKAQIKIIFSDYSGIYVKKCAVHESNNGNGETGVYVRRGKQIVFKKINIIYSNENYYLCKINSNISGLDNKETLKEFDEIVINGKNLYDGKII